MSLQVKHIMQRRETRTIKETANLRTLNRILAETQFSGLPVVNDEDKVVGVVSQSDIVRLIAKDLATPPGFYESTTLHQIAQGNELARDICEKQVSEIMERRIRSITPEELVSNAAQMMRNLRVHRILVMLKSGELVGIVTAFDLLQILEKPTAFQEFYKVAEV